MNRNRQNSKASARNRGAQGKGGLSEMSLSAVIPAFNEEEVIEAMIAHALEALGSLGLARYEVIVVNDGSRDGTRQVLEQLEARHAPMLRPIHHERNMGYGSALRTGFRAARYPLVFFTDADLQFDMGELPRLLEKAGQFDIVCGYRAKRRDSPRRLFISRVYNTSIRMLFGLRIRDVDCAFKVFRKEVLDAIDIKFPGFTVNLEVLAKAKQRGYTVYEVPVTHYPRKAGSSTVTIKSILATMRNIVRLKRELRRA